MRYLLISLLLTGCVVNRLGARLTPFVGQDIHVAIKRLGYPTQTREIVGDIVYTWVTDIRAPYPCKIELAAAPDGIIKTFSLEGTEAGCKPYNDALDN